MLSAVALAGCATNSGAANVQTQMPPEQVKLDSLVLRDPRPPADPTNRHADDPKAAELGHRLFFDPGFSGTLLSTDNNVIGGAPGVPGQRGKVACQSCHVAKDGFVDTRTFGKRISLASSWVLRRTPSLFDVAQVPLLMWDGRRSTLFGQAIGPVESADELNGSRLFLAQEIARRYRAAYEAIFGPIGDLGPELAAALNGCTEESFGTPFDARPPAERGCHGMPGDRAEYDALSTEQKASVDAVAANFGKALAAYQRQLSCGPGRFDAWMNGEANALSEREIAGARLFVGRGKCIECHSGPYFSDHEFHNVGLRPERVTNFLIDENDPGASEGLPFAILDPFGASGPHSDAKEIPEERRPRDATGPQRLGAFRTPMLRCVSKRPSFMHTASLSSLKRVVEFFNKGGDSTGFLGAKTIAPLGLRPEEVDALVAFLQTLDGAGPDSRWVQPPP